MEDGSAVRLQIQCYNQIYQIPVVVQNENEKKIKAIFEQGTRYTPFVI